MSPAEDCGNQYAVVAEVWWSQAVQTLVDERCYLELNPPSNRKPMEITQDRCDVVEFPCPGDQPGGSILHPLQLVQQTALNTSKQAVTIIQSAAHEGIHERLRSVVGQRVSHQSQLT